MHLKKIYTLIFIVNIVLLQATEDFSVHVELKERNITSLSQLIPIDSKDYYDIGYYLPIDVSYINNTDTVQHLLIGGGPCTSIESYEIKGRLQFIKEKRRCRKTTYGYNIILQPKERLTRTRKLLFPKSYFNKRVHFKIGFKKIIWNHASKNQTQVDAGFRHILTYWSDWVVINADAERIYGK